VQLAAVGTSVFARSPMAFSLMVSELFSCTFESDNSNLVRFVPDVTFAAVMVGNAEIVAIGTHQEVM
jgi:hypothetical protein